MAAEGECRFPVTHMAAVGAWLVPWVLYGRRGCLAGPLGPMWPPWGRGRSPGPRVAAV